MIWCTTSNLHFSIHKILQTSVSLESCLETTKSASSKSHPGDKQPHRRSGAWKKGRKNVQGALFLVCRLFLNGIPTFAPLQPQCFATFQSLFPFLEMFLFLDKMILFFSLSLFFHNMLTIFSECCEFSKKLFKIAPKCLKKVSPKKKKMSAGN